MSFADATQIHNSLNDNIVKTLIVKIATITVRVWAKIRIQRFIEKFEKKIKFGTIFVRNIFLNECLFWK